MLWRDIGCEICHGSHVLGLGERVLPDAMPDLRYMAPATHAVWQGIVLGGSRRLQGMPAVDVKLSVEDSEALHAYLIEQAWKAYSANANSRD